MAKIKMLTNYRHFFREGDVVTIPDECDEAKAKELVRLGRAEWVEEGAVDLASLKYSELRERARSLGLSTRGNKKELIERIRAAEDANE